MSQARNQGVQEVWTNPLFWLPFTCTFIKVKICLTLEIYAHNIRSQQTLQSTPKFNFRASIYFSKISWGACPQTLSISMLHMLIVLRTITQNQRAPLHAFV